MMRHKQGHDVIGLGLVINGVIQNQQYKEQKEKQGNQLGGRHRIQPRDASGMNQRSSSSGGEKRLDAGHILEVRAMIC